MKFSKDFVRNADEKGQLVYRRRQNVKVPIRLLRTSARIEGATGQRLSYSFFMDQGLLAQGSGTGDQPLVLEPNTRVPRGEREFVFIADGFAPNQTVAGVLDIEFSFF